MPGGTRRRGAAAGVPRRGAARRCRRVWSAGRLDPPGVVGPPRHGKTGGTRARRAALGAGPGAGGPRLDPCRPPTAPGGAVAVVPNVNPCGTFGTESPDDPRLWTEPQPTCVTWTPSWAHRRRPDSSSQLRPGFLCREPGLSQVLDILQKAQEQRSRLLEGVLHLLAGLLQATGGLVLLALRLEVTVVGGVAEGFLALAGEFLGLVLHLVRAAHL